MADTEQGALSSLAALNKLSEDPIDKNRGWLAYAAGALQPTTGGGFGQSMGNALGAMSNVQGAQEALKASYIPHVTQALIDAAKLQHQMQIDRNITNILGRSQSNYQQPNQPMQNGPTSIDLNAPENQPSPQGQSAPVQQPVQSPQSAGPIVNTGNMPQQQTGLAGLSPEELAYMKIYGKDVTPEYKLATTGQLMEPGMHRMPDGKMVYVADPTKGIGYDQSGNVIALPGFNKTNTEIEGSKAGAIAAATEAAKAPFTTETITGPDGQPHIVTHAQTLQQLNGQTQPSQTPVVLAHPAVGAAAEATGIRPSLLNAMISTESNGNPSAVSSKGATGMMQLMPDTAKQLGVTNPNDPVQNIAGGATYMKQLQDKYGDEKLALVAYNMGPGATDKWLANGANFNKLPAETQGYVSKVLLNEATANHAAANAPQQQGIPVQSESQKAQAAADVKIKNDPFLNYSNDAAKNLAEKGKALSGQVAESQDLLKRIDESRQAMTQFKAGGGTETRTEVAKALQGLPFVTVPQSIIDKVSGGSLDAAQTFQKYAAQEALQTMRQSLASDDGKGSQGNRVAMQLFIKNNPNLDTDPRAIEKIFNFQTKLHNQLLDQQDHFVKYVSDPNAQKDVSAFDNSWAHSQIDKGYVKPKIVTGAAMGAQPDKKIATAADIAATAKASGRSATEVTNMLKAKGYTIGGQ